MKVLLLQDVYNLGQAGDVKSVADGYGRNYLLPRGLAVLATPETLKRAERVRQAALQRRAQEKADLEAIARIIDGARFVFHARAGEKGKLYGSVTAAQIAAQIAAKLGREEFDRRRVMLREPLREIGTYTVKVHVAPEMEPQITVVVLPEGIVEETEAEANPAEAAADAQPTAVADS